ncbi:hypothetical protein DSUL_100125 [Desulfovibrionales bacterium]
MSSNSARPFSRFITNVTRLLVTNCGQNYNYDLGIPQLGLHS